MSTATFIRLLGECDKGSGLSRAVKALREGKTPEGVVYRVDPEAFREVPGTPFAYWVSERIRRLFNELPPFEGEGRTVRQGLATADDFRFVRTWWEVPAERTLDGGNGPDWRKDLEAFQEWCRRRTHEGKRWAPFAKGGEYSPFYADIHLVVNWERDGAEIRSFVDPKTDRTFSRPQNTEYYFRPGLTWPRRTQGGLSFRGCPAGSVFADKGPVAFVPPEQLFQLLGVVNSPTFRALVEAQMAFGSYEVGVIQRSPVPPSDALTAQAELAALVNGVVSARTVAAARAETVWTFRGIDVRIPRPADHEDRIDKIVNSLYGVALASPRLVEADSEQADAEDSRRLGRYVGLAFGRWDLRMFRDQSLIPELADPFDPLAVSPPVMLVGPDGLPARFDGIASDEWLRVRPDASRLPPPGTVSRPSITSGEYPFEVPWDGILVDDPGLEGEGPAQADLARRLRKVLDVTHGDRAAEIEAELSELLEVEDLRDYLGRPAGFFADHLSRYSRSRRKAPIYWPLSTESGGYTIWLYYPRLTADTLYRAVSGHLEPKLARVEQRLAQVEGQQRGAAGREAAKLAKEIGGLAALRDELRAMREELLRVAQLPYRPNLDDGVQITAAPLWRLFRHKPWRKTLEDTWKELEKGDYDWAHLAYAIWPDRVREKCKKDRSLAIAHELEETGHGRSTRSGGRG